MRLPCLARRLNSRKAGWIMGISSRSTVYSQKVKSDYYCISGLAALARLLFGAEGGEHGAAHGRFRGALSRPDFPLSEALRKKHLDAGDGGDSLFCGEFQEMRALRAVDQVHHHAAAQLAGGERRDSSVRVHADGCGVEDGVKEFGAQGAARNYLSTHGAGQRLRCFLAP